MTELYRNWFLASRPWSFIMTAISTGVGGAVAAIDGPFSWGLFAATLLGAVFLHAATNLINDYYDVQKGVDTVEAATAQYRPHPLVEGKLRPKSVLAASFLLFAIGAGIGLWLAAERGWPILAIGTVGVLASLAYTAPPVSYKYIALGEFSVFLMWGPLMVEGTYYVQHQQFSAHALWISIPFGTIVALVLLANNLRDIAHDKSRRIRTIAIVLGAQKGFYLYAALIAAAYASIPVMILAGVLSWWSLMVFFSVPIAVSILRIMSEKIPKDADARTARLDTVFGVLLLISLIAEALL
ncbi:MAG: 1,4-dihydroxy-2-naphthoate octaprenyltransferase [Desulfosalsimonas sp.]|uniref:1,4-dihydroxy-2-naphthoate octaprenyltransferase n=1 Tax=Desulfosalsimonas sp. TaxID=3073848 RepID=UPI0039709F37